MPAKQKQAWKARWLLPYLDAGCGAALFEPLAMIENGVILAEDGIITAVGANLRVPAAYELLDYGDSIICPPVVNAHTHLQLSWLQDSLVWGQGFTTWLQSMLPGIFPVIGTGFGKPQEEALKRAVEDLLACGTGHVGDVGGSIPGALAAMRDADLPITHFCEWFGFGEDERSPWPKRCREEICAAPDIAAACAPCGHALYSTSARQMQRAQAWCKAADKIFTFHLAESPEETEMLVSGSGPLVELYRGSVLPDTWHPEGLSPARLALKYGLLKKNTLAVHCVHLEQTDIPEFAATGAAICLCPRSNSNLAVGSAPVKEFIDAEILLCLGTDGLTSCEDLDIRNEAYFLKEQYDLPGFALLRMAIANGRIALGLDLEVIACGKKACFSVWPLGDLGNGC